MNEAIKNALRIARATGGKVEAHSGPIHSLVAGRTDHLPMHVHSGSYVLPADIVSAMGEGNTMAGFKAVKIAFGEGPYGGGKPYGAGKEPYGGGTPYGEKPKQMYGMDLPEKAEGGKVSDGALVPIVAAGGECVLHPQQVAELGKGSLEDGHKILDLFVKKMRDKHIKTLQKLPGPKKD